MALEPTPDTSARSAPVPGPSDPVPHGEQAWSDLLIAMDRQIADCSWCNEQTHESLVKFLLEETHELAEAIETGDRTGMREELGDVLLQIVFHSRIASAAQEEPFTADDVVRDLTAKMIRRHPHVFAGQEIDGDLVTQWDAIKRTETIRTSILDGIPATLGSLAYTQKVLGRAARAGMVPALSSAGPATNARPCPDAGPATDVGPAPRRDEDAPDSALVATEDECTEQIGAELLALVQRAAAAGVDAEGALRGAARELVQHVRTVERTDAEGADETLRVEG